MCQRFPPQTLARHQQADVEVGFGVGGVELEGLTQVALRFGVAPELPEDSTPVDEHLWIGGF